MRGFVAFKCVLVCATFGVALAHAEESADSFGEALKTTKAATAYVDGAVRAQYLKLVGLAKKHELPMLVAPKYTYAGKSPETTPGPGTKSQDLLSEILLRPNLKPVATSVVSVLIAGKPTSLTAKVNEIYTFGDSKKRKGITRVLELQDIWRITGRDQWKLVSSTLQ